MSAAYYRTLTVDHTKVTGTQSDFPVLVSITDPTLKSVANGGHVNNGSGFDLGFYADSVGATKLKWEMESYDAAAGTIVAHVKIPSVSSGANTVFYMFYGDPAISTDQSNPAGVWSNGYVGVWHLGDGVTVNTADSLGTHAGTIGGPVAAVTGQIRGGAWFQSPSYMVFGDIGVHGTPLSIEAWIAPYNNVYAAVLHSNSWDGFYCSHDPSGLTHALVTVTGGFAAYAVGSQVSAGAMVWQHITAVWASDSSRQMFVNGSGGAIETTTIVPGATPDAFILGADWSFGNNFYGYLDEVRVSNVARSSDWITTAYNAQSAPNAFLTLGGEQSAVSDTVVVLTGVSASPQVGAGTVLIGVAAPPQEALVAGGSQLRWLTDETVQLTGVAASPAVGEITTISSGTLEDLVRAFPFPRAQPVELPVTRRKRVAKPSAPIPRMVYVYPVGLKSVPKIGVGRVTTVFDLLDEELLILLEDA